MPDDPSAYYDGGGGNEAAGDEHPSFSRSRRFALSSLKKLVPSAHTMEKAASIAGQTALAVTQAEPELAANLGGKTGLALQMAAAGEQVAKTVQNNNGSVTPPAASGAGPNATAGGAGVDGDDDDDDGDDGDSGATSG